MIKFTKKIVQTPRELKAERNKWLSMQRVINVELARIDPRYEIRNLIRRPDGGFEFEAATEFKKGHATQIERVFSLLEQEETEFVQAKFYLPRVVQKRVKRWAVDLGVPESSLVAAILDERAREERG